MAEFDMIGLDAAIANAMRRVMIAEVGGGHITDDVLQPIPYYVT